MALTGLHVSFGLVIDTATAALAAPPRWSETLAAAGMTTRAALRGHSPNFQINSGVDAFVAVGPAPDPTATAGDGNTARFFLPGGETRNIACTTGDKVAWVPA